MMELLCLTTTNLIQQIKKQQEQDQLKQQSIQLEKPSNKIPREYRITTQSMSLTTQAS